LQLKRTKARLFQKADVGNPLLPLQILFINIITDVFPALALGVGKENDKLMQSPPRGPKSRFLK
jgi:Ca2+-transporting ATPase